MDIPNIIDDVLNRRVSETSWSKRLDAILRRDGFTIEYATVGSGIDTRVEMRATGMIGTENVGIVMSTDINGRVIGNVSNYLKTLQSYKDAIDFVAMIRRLNSPVKEWDDIIEKLGSKGFVKMDVESCSIMDALFMRNEKECAMEGTCRGEETVVLLVKGYTTYPKASKPPKTITGVVLTGRMENRDGLTRINTTRITTFNRETRLYTEQKMFFTMKDMTDFMNMMLDPAVSDDAMAAAILAREIANMEMLLTSGDPVTRDSSERNAGAMLVNTVRQRFHSEYNRKKQQLAEIMARLRHVEEMKNTPAGRIASGLDDADVPRAKLG